MEKHSVLLLATLSRQGVCVVTMGYDKREERFWLHADRCILKKKALLNRIMKVMRLPPETKTETDPHYCCSVCLRRIAERQE